MPENDPILAFWGKAQPFEGAKCRYHPLAYHALDVAAVAEALLDTLPRVSSRLVQAFSAASDASRLHAGLVALIALHDIGKFARGFQAKVPDLWPAVLGPLPQPLPNIDHVLAGDWLMRGPLTENDLPLFEGWRKAGINALVPAVLSHHGVPMQAESISSGLIGASAVDAAREFTRRILDLFGNPSLPPLREKQAAAISWQLSGLATLADWIGSNQNWFPYHPPGLSLEAYWIDVARPQARAAISAAAIAPARVAPHSGFAALTGRSDSPSPGQLWAESVSLPDGPILAILEDVMGSGKTEAALVLAHRLMIAGRADGLYIALPTMATANAMFDRLAASYERLFETAERPSLALAHGARNLNRRFSDIILPAGTAEFRYGASEGDETASAQCAAWIADDRRKTFFAHVGVGTIDQALLSVLPSKHATMRLFGLSGRVLVVDEAHAYDAYVSRELETLLRFHAALGGSAIILSATLPEAAKAKLARGFAAGVDASRPVLKETDYPLATIVSRSEASETPVAIRPDLTRRLGVRRLDTVASALEHLAAAARAGAAVVYIRNSVDDAIEAVAALRREGLPADLFHARFTMEDRLRIERAALETFGRESQPDVRRGRVLVATQVVEQSLDLDFDLMVSDLAPIDLLIQRSGRIWRHRRERRPVDRPEFLVVAPDPDGPVAADWFSHLFPRAAYVYANHALVWRSAKVLFDAGEIVSPEGIRRLVEEAYAEDAVIPKALEKSWNEAFGRSAAEISVAGSNLLNFEAGYCAGNGAWGSDVRTPTRLGDERITLRLARIEGGRLVPWAADDEPRRAWAMSEISIRAGRVAGRGAYPTAIEKIAQALESEWFGDRLLLPLSVTGARADGLVVDRQGHEGAVVYDPGVGLLFGDHPETGT